MYYLSHSWGGRRQSGGHRNADQYPDRISIGGTDNKVLTLELYKAVEASDIVTLSYSGGTNLLRTASGNHAAPAISGPGGDQHHGRRGRSALLQRASVAGKSLKLVFDSPLDTEFPACGQPPSG